MKKDTSPLLEVELKSGIDHKATPMLEKYWLFSNGTFENRPTDIANEHRINTARLAKIVNENSTAKLILGNCLECKKCNSRIVNVQSAAKKLIEMPPYLCITCEEAVKSNNIGVSKKQAILNKLNHSFRNSAWLLLSKIEFDVLNEIIRQKSNRTLRSNQLKNNWKFMEVAYRLRHLGLISYDLYDERGFDIFFLPELKQYLATPHNCPISEGGILRLRVSMSSIDSKKKIKFYYEPLNLSKPFILKKGIGYHSRLRRISQGELFFELDSLALVKTGKADEHTHPPYDHSNSLEKLVLKDIVKSDSEEANEWTYSRQFALSNDIVFRKGINLVCRVIENFDESITISISPKKTVGAESKETAQPMSIESLIEQYFKLIKTKSDARFE